MSCDSLKFNDSWHLFQFKQIDFERLVGATDNIVTEFATYEDFLDSQITPLDLYYLEVMIL